MTINGVTYKLQLMIVNNQSDEEKAVTTANRLVSAGVSVVLGSCGSSISEAASAIFSEAGIPMIACSCSLPSLTQDNDFVFRIGFLDSLQAEAIANYALGRGAQTGYVLTQTDDADSVSLGEQFSEQFSALGGTVITASCSARTTGYSSYLNSAAQSGADLVFAPASPAVSEKIIRQAAGRHYEIPILSGSYCETAEVMDAVESGTLELYFSSLFDENASDTASRFVGSFRSWLRDDSERIKDNGGSLVSPFSALGYDAYNAAVAAIVSAESPDPTAIRDALAQITLSNAVTGELRFDENGNAVRELVYIKTADMEAGAYSVIKTQTVRQTES